MAKTALVPIADGTEEMEAVTIINVLRRGGVQVTAASVSGRTVTGSRSVTLSADRLIGDCLDQTYDLIALPGGMPGAEHLRDCKPLVEMLKKQKKEGRLIAAICASPAVALAAHGLLDDCKATGYPSMVEQLPQKGEGQVVTDGNCVTSQGPATAIDFALELVRILRGQTIAGQVAKAMLAKF